ncbi:unnamed protein product [Symbiodinium sp. CCMP2592]|nr:unnamed protein product [Symbiodinium sp. CCMP2592]
MASRVEGDRLADLNSGSGAQANVLVRTIRCFSYEVQAKNKKSFVVLATTVIDCDDNMTHLVEHFFGPRQKELLSSREAYWLPEGKPTLFRLKDMKKVQAQHFGRMAASVSNMIQVENLSTPKASLKAVPILRGSPEEKHVKTYYMPRQPLTDLHAISEGMFVTIAGVLVSVGKAEPTSQGFVLAISIADQHCVVEGIKIWKADESLFSKANMTPGQRSMVVLHNFWAGVSEDAAPGVQKIVNVADRSSVTVLCRTDLTSTDAAVLDRADNSTPAETICLDDHAGKQSQTRKKTMVQWSSETATQSSVISLQHCDEDGLYRLDAVVPEVDMTQDSLTKQGNIFAKLVIMDTTGKMHIRAGAEVLAELCGLPPDAASDDELRRMLATGVMHLARATLYVERRAAPDKDDPSITRINFVAQAARSSFFAADILTGVAPRSACILPCSLDQLRVAFGKLQVDNVTAEGPLLLMTGSKAQPRTTVDGQDFCIENIGAACMLSRKCCTVKSKVPLQVQTSFVLEPGRPAPVLVGGMEHISTDGSDAKIILHARMIWKNLGMEEDLALKAFTQEKVKTQEHFERAGRKKRSLPDLVLELKKQEVKKCRSIDAAYGGA